MQISVKNQKKRYAMLQVKKWILFVFLIGFCYILETAGSYKKPLLLIPLALCIASHTGEVQAMSVGAVCGLLLDLACDKLIGFNAIFLVLGCTSVSLLYRYLLKQKLLNMLFLTTVFVLIQGFVDYIFYYVIWDYEGSELILQKYILPSCCMTIVSAVIFYFLIKKIAEKCGSHRIQKLEKMNLSTDSD